MAAMNAYDIPCGLDMESFDRNSSYDLSKTEGKRGKNSDHVLLPQQRHLDLFPNCVDFRSGTIIELENILLVLQRPLESNQCHRFEAREYRLDDDVNEEFCRETSRKRTC